MARPRAVAADPAARAGIAALGAPLNGVPAAGRGATAQQVCERLRRAIVELDLVPGAPLTEQDVAAQLGVSRTPVREALRKLAGEGLVVVLPQKGTFVARLRRDALHDALFVREALECAAARRACHASEAARRGLLAIVRAQRAAVRRGDVEGGLAADEALHRAIVELSGHASAWEVVRQARAQLERLRRIAGRELKGSKQALGYHQRIAEAIVAGDEEAADELLRRHLAQVHEFFERVAQLHPEYVEAPAAWWPPPRGCEPGPGDPHPGSGA